MRISGLLSRQLSRVVPVLLGPPLLAFLPAITLGAFWFGGEAALIFTSLALPLAFAFAGAFGSWPAKHSADKTRYTGFASKDGYVEVLNETFEQSKLTGMKSASFQIEIDDYSDLIKQYGSSAAELVTARTGDRILSAVRNRDAVALLHNCTFAVCLSPVPQLDLELCIQLAGRIQSAVEDPISIDGTAVYVSCSIGFCQNLRIPGNEASDWLEASKTALLEAKANGPSTIRAYSPEMQQRTKIERSLRAELSAALGNGQIQPWYQPQISTDTGRVTGFEALARWVHPVRGVLTPDKFLPLVEQAGLLERLGQVMMYHSMTALKAWDSAGVDVPRVGVNFASDELRNPELVEKVQWELDRFDLTPDRLSVEILETVFSNTPDDTITRNVAGLGALGCRIDLDDFGTGHASIASIRRFAISRIKIDRSFVMKADRDPEQQRLIGAILTMAERLELETLAEGVETVGEHALLAQLGCDHVQGFGIAKPMPFDQTLDWIALHQAKLQDAPRIGRETG